MSSRHPTQVSVREPVTALLLGVIAVLLVSLRLTPVLTALSGLLLVLVLPGFVWVRAFRVRDHQPLVEPALIVAGSLGITMVVGLLTDAMPGGVTRTNWCIGLEAAVVLGVVVTLGRTALIPAGAPLPGPGSAAAERRPRPERRALAIRGAQMLSLVGCLAVAGWVSVRSEARWEARQHFTAVGITEHAHAGAPTLSVTNHEGHAVSYTVMASLGHHPVFSRRLRVGSGQTRQLALSHITPPAISGTLFVNVDRPGQPSPYREVWLRGRYGLWR